MDAITHPPQPVNEPILGYAPGSSERAELHAAIKELADADIDLTMTIGGEQSMGSGDPIAVVQPHRHSARLGTLGDATAEDVQRAIGAALTVAPAWAEFYQSGWHEPRGSAFVVPQGLVSAVVDPESGELATEWCPRHVREWYKPGSEPQEPCHLHAGMPEGQIAVDANGNVTATPGANPNDPISQAAKGIGNILRKIIHW